MLLVVTKTHILLVYLINDYVNLCWHNFYISSSGRPWSRHYWLQGLSGLTARSWAAVNSGRTTFFSLWTVLLILWWVSFGTVLQTDNFHKIYFLDLFKRQQLLFSSLQYLEENRYIILLWHISSYLYFNCSPSLLV